MNTKEQKEDSVELRLKRSADVMSQEYNEDHSLITEQERLFRESSNKRFEAHIRQISPNSTDEEVSSLLAIGIYHRDVIAPAIIEGRVKYVKRY
jgi:hypothetical protein